MIKRHLFFRGASNIANRKHSIDLHYLLCLIRATSYLMDQNVQKFRYPDFNNQRFKIISCYNYSITYFLKNVNPCLRFQTLYFYSFKHNKKHLTHICVGVSKVLYILNLNMLIFNNCGYFIAPFIFFIIYCIS